MHCGDFLIKISDKTQMSSARSDYLVGRISLIKTYGPLASSPRSPLKSRHVSICASSGYFVEKPATFLRTATQYSTCKMNKNRILIAVIAVKI